MNHRQYRLLTVLAATLLSVPLHAQMVVGFANQTSEIKMKVVDSLTNEPLSYVSVYLVPVKDTIITNFAITDSTGSIRIRDVAVGGYTVNAELLGYKPWTKERYLKNWFEDLGTIKLQEDKEWLDAAKIVAAGNPVEVKGDTIVFNAAMFKVGENSMLEDMLKKMPGFEVSSDGKVTLNGESIDKITVGGKTFFFDDPSVAVKNLPAKIVDKVKVINQESDNARFTGIEGERTKVMDLELKEEFKKGFFGNAGLYGGTSLAPDEPDTRKLQETRNLLYNGNLLASLYNEKDQLSIIANGYNVEAGDVVYIMSSSSSGEDVMPVDNAGLTTSCTAGLNYNTTAIKNFETSAMAKYKHTGNNARSMKSRTTLMSGTPDIITNSESSSNSSRDQAGVSFELVNLKANKNWYFSFSPSISFSGGDGSSMNTSSTNSAAGEMMNNSYSLTTSSSDSFSTSGRVAGGINKLGKSKGNSIVATLSYSLSNTESTSTEHSSLYGGSGLIDAKNLLYDGTSSSLSLRGTLEYVQKLTAKAKLSLTGSYRYGRNSSDRDAFDIIDKDSKRANDYYSSFSNTTDNSASASLLYQYRSGAHNLQAGFTGEATNKVTTARSLGVTTTSGLDEILWSWTPNLRYSYRREQTTFSANYRASTTQPNQARVLPVLNLSNRTNLSAGNIYLKPSLNHTLGFGLDRSDRERYFSCSANFNSSIMQRQFVTASWLDESGVRNSFQVNSAKPSVNMRLIGFLSARPGEKKMFTLGSNPSVVWNSAVSYQAQGRLKGFDVENFDYNKFISEFWGTTDAGENFYSGRSGFRESRTRSVHISAPVSLAFRYEEITLSLFESPNWSITRYSVDPSANTNIFRNSISLYAEYTTPDGWEFDNQISYTTFRGYSDGYGDPYTNWDFEINKSIKAFTFSLSINDILNQRTNLTHVSQEDYIEDSYKNILGRYFLIGVKWNFGKKNAAQGRNAQSAQIRMMGL